MQRDDERSRAGFNHRRRFLLKGMAGSAAVLAGCGGGGGGGGQDSASPGTPAPNQPDDPEPTTPSVPDPAPAPATHPPRGLHVSVQDNSNRTRTLTWFTDGAEAPRQRLEYDQPDGPWDEARIQSRPLLKWVYAFSEETFGVDARTHRAMAPALDPDKPFRYRVGSPEGGWSRVYWIDAIPRDNWTFIHYGDVGVNDRARRVIGESQRHQRDLLVLAGDLSYANGDQPVWDQWFDMAEPLLASTVTMAAAGNHEGKDGQGLTAGKAFKSRLTHPDPLLDNLNPNPGSTYYAFDVNRVHFFVSSAGALIEDFSLAEELVNLEIDLAKAAARRARGEIDFIVLVQHYPIWTDQDGRSPANFALVTLQENILLRYGVDLLLVGHDHVYQRSKRMAYGVESSLGYVQVLCGTGGASVRLFDEAPQGWSAKQFVGIGLVHYQVEPGRITGEFWGAAPEGLEDDKRQTVTAPFQLEDRFVVEKRDHLACLDCVRPARPASRLLRDYPQIVAHTRERNRLHMIEEHGG